MQFLIFISIKFPVCQSKIYVTAVSAYTRFLYVNVNSLIVTCLFAFVHRLCFSLQARKARNLQDLLDRAVLSHCELQIVN
jgi:hypothetical protein